MKKIAVILSSSFYLLLSTGVVVSAHYCSNKVASVSFYATDIPDCCGEEDAADDCCHNKTQLVKLEDDQNNKQQLISIPKIAGGPAQLLWAQPAPIYNVTKNTFRIYTERKLPPGNKVYLRNSTWLI